MKIRILLADDHTILRAGLRMMLNAQPDFEVVGEAQDGRQAIQEAQKLQPDVVIQPTLQFVLVLTQLVQQQLQRFLPLLKLQIVQ